MGLLFEHSGGGASYAASLALLGNVIVAPILLFSPFAGAWVDRLPLKTVLVIADILRALLVLAIPWLYSTSDAASNDPSIVFAIVFMLFAINVVFLPAKSALIPEIVPRDRLLAANSLLAFAGILATAIGALLGGWVVDRWGWAVAMRIDSASYLLSVIGLSLVANPPRQNSPRLVETTASHYLKDVAHGWRLVSNNSLILTALLALGTVWFVGGMLHVAGNDHVQAVASMPGMLRVGILLCAIGIGTALGTWWINRHGKHIDRARLLGLGLLLAASAVALFAATRLFAVFVPAAFLFGVFAAPALILTETVLQEASTTGQRARVFSTKDFIMRLTLLVSMSLSAWAIAVTGARITLAICALILLAMGALVFARRSTPPTTVL